MSEVLLSITYDNEAHIYICSDSISTEFGVGDTVAESITNWISEIEAFEQHFSPRMHQVGCPLKEELEAVQTFLYPVKAQHD